MVEKKVFRESVPASETVETTKTGIVKFLGSGLLPEMEVALQLLIAAADTRHGVSCTSGIQKTGNLVESLIGMIQKLSENYTPFFWGHL